MGNLKVIMAADETLSKIFGSSNKMSTYQFLFTESFFKTSIFAQCIQESKSTQSTDLYLRLYMPILLWFVLKRYTIVKFIHESNSKYWFIVESKAKS